ncbi:MAG: type II toxin-antitoxin system RelE/ParE family toxin [Planctomycetaceae bacterium]|jgi:toxin ParE1/3/4|nr:type II toxin-antitoxin system RelE/ParE family toxin [Planctomycetaceae bacterium]
MTLFLDILSQARNDIMEISRYISERNLSAADRFVDAVDQTIQRLCDNPTIGERLYSDPTGKIRLTLVSGFRNYLIFFRQEETVLQVLRVLHGARDFSNLFD